MKRITILLTDELYSELIAYTADESKKKVRRLSLGNSMRSLISSRLEQLGYRDLGLEASGDRAQRRAASPSEVGHVSDFQRA